MNSMWGWAKRARLAVATALLLCAGPAVASADYLLGSGDVLEVSVFGVADFNRKVVVNVDGNVSLPFLGEVPASGRSITELRKAITSVLLQDGTMLKPVVTVELVEHRPFYITGDVSHPGALPYRPGLTVRRAIALAGGYDVLHFRSEELRIAAPELQSQNSSLWATLVKREAHKLAVQAEIDGKEEVDFSKLSAAPIPRTLIDEVINLEKELFKGRVADFHKQDAFFRKTIDQYDKNISALQDVIKQQKASVEVQASISSMTTMNNKKGIAPVMRVNEEVRGLSLMKSQLVESEIRFAQTAREHTDLERQLEKFNADRQSKLLQDLQDTILDADRIKAQIKAIEEKLLLVSASKSQANKSAIGLMIYRQSATGEEQDPATEDTPLHPDDVLEVTIRPQ